LARVRARRPTAYRRHRSARKSATRRCYEIVIYAPADTLRCQNRLLGRPRAGPGAGGLPSSQPLSRPQAAAQGSKDGKQ